MMSPSELEAIDDWMFAIRIRSRGEAIRRLCQIGINFDRSAGKLLGTSMAGSASTTKAATDFENSVNDPKASKIEIHNKGLEAALSGIRALIDLSAQLGTLWAVNSTLKTPEKFDEALKVALAVREKLEDPGLSVNAKLDEVTRFMALVQASTPDELKPDE
jgi:hypothetical protein